MSGNKVSVEITLEEKAALKALTQLTKEIQKTENSFTKMGSEGDNSLGILSQATSGVSTGFKSLVGGVTIANLASTAIIGVANEIKSFIVGSVNAAVEQENAINRLNQALKASGDFSSASSQDLLSFATNLQKVSVFGDEVVVGQLAVAKSFGASNEQAKQLVEAAANLSATFGGSLESNVEKLGKTFSGEAGRLAQYIPAIKELTAEQLKSGDAFEIVNSKFAGAAANELNTYSGQVTSLSNAYSDLQEELGAFVTQSSRASGATGILKEIFESATQSLVDFRIELERGENGFLENADSLNQLTREYAGLTEKIEALEQKDSLLPGGLDSFDTSKIKAFRAELAALEAQINNASTEVLVTERKEALGATGDGSPTGISPSDQKLIDSRLSAYAQLEIARAEFEASEAEATLLKQEAMGANYAIELEALTAAEAAKVMAVFAAEEQKASLIKDAQERSYAQEKIAINKKLALRKAADDSEKKLNAMLIAENNKRAAEKIALIGQTAELGNAILKDGSREAFLVGKAAALAQVAVSTATGMSNALLIPDPTPTRSIQTAALIHAKVTGALSAATIVASSIKGYEKGGIIPGASMTGDNVMARVNSGEMILNRQQQAELFNVANGSGTGSRLESLLEKLIEVTQNHSQDILIDGRAIASAVRGQIKGGFKLS